MSESVPSAGDQVLNAVKAVADVAILPGSSQLVQGEVLSGVEYAAVGFLASWLTRWAIGPIGWIAVGLDSYSMSVSQKHLWQLLGSGAPRAAASGNVNPAGPETVGR